MSFCPVSVHKTVEKMFIIGECYINSLLFGYRNIVRIVDAAAQNI